MVPEPTRQRRRLSARSLGDEVSTAAKVTDILGRLLLVWYLIETIRYFWAGRFGVEVGQLKHSFAAPLTPCAAVASLQIAVAALGVFILIPLLWRGAWSGLIAGLLYWAWGYTTNPLQFMFPESDLTSSGEGPTGLLSAISVVWMAATLALLIAFFFARRSIVAGRGKPGHRVGGVVP
jgi:hypothetical protein